MMQGAGGHNKFGGRAQLLDIFYHEAHEEHEEHEEHEGASPKKKSF